MKDNWFKLGIAILVTVYGSYLNYLGHNGLVMASVFTLLGLLAGVKLDKVVESFQKQKI